MHETRSKGKLTDILERFRGASPYMRNRILKLLEKMDKYPSEQLGRSIEEMIPELSVDFLDGDLVWNHRGERT
jgi:hypothetical protein